MSAAYYRTRIHWDGHRGHGEIRHDGVTVELLSPPDIGIPHIRMLEFSPGVRIFEVRVSAERTRDLTPAECKACMQLLERCVAAARAALTKKETPDASDQSPG